MDEIKIPHGESTFVELDPPREILHVVTKLPYSTKEPDFNEPRHEMIMAIGKLLGRGGFDDYKIHWGDSNA